MTASLPRSYQSLCVTLDEGFFDSDSASQLSQFFDCRWAVSGFNVQGCTSASWPGRQGVGSVGTSPGSEYRIRPARRRLQYCKLQTGKRKSEQGQITNIRSKEWLPTQNKERT